MKNFDLFGGETEKGRQTLLNKAGYRKATLEEKNAGTVCGVCAYSIRKKWDKTYYKCELIGDSNAPTTDIRLSGTCPKFKKEE